MYKKCFYGMAVLFVLGFSGCIPFQHMESGRTYSKGEGAIGGSISTYTLNDSGSEVDNITIPYFDVKGKYGISDRFEVGFGLNSIGYFIGEGKYQFLGDKTSKTAMSVGVDLSSLFLGTGENSPDLNLKIGIPLYFSRHFSDKWYFFFNPQYSVLFVQNEDLNQFFGASTGMGYVTNFGEWNFGLTYMAAQSISPGGSVVQVGLGYRHFVFY